MKIGFFGTPEIAARCLERLHGVHEICFLVTQEDKKTGRHQHLLPPPAKESARARGIPVLQPGRLKEPAVIDDINRFDADLYVVVAYGRIIPRDIFDHPKYKTINLHPSLLPQYRGAAPIEWALMDGVATTGITVQRINEDLDAGDILLQEEIPVGPDMTAGDLYHEAIDRGGDLLDRAIRSLGEGTARPRQQDHDAATYCKKIDRDTARISWSRQAVGVHNLVRGLNPKPVAWTEFRGKGVRIWKTRLPGDLPAMTLEPGEIARFQKKRLLTGTGGGIVEILEIQPENRDVLEALSFINGYRIAQGDRFI